MRKQMLPIRKTYGLIHFFIHPDLYWPLSGKQPLITRVTVIKHSRRFSKDIQAFMASYDDDLDEKVPQYISNDLRKPTPASIL